MIAKIVSILTILSSLAITVDSEKVFHLFADSYREGHLITYGRPDDDRNCYNIDYRFARKARSIKNGGFCVNLYSHNNCQGDRIRSEPYCSRSECCFDRDFEWCDFAYKASSFKLC
uniref:Secreted protein n=1 Tax=Panagrellus redivivus TaxID=6233 RepID=A0A7E4USI6_PANRE